MNGDVTRHPVVLPHEDGVDRGQSRILRSSALPGRVLDSPSVQRESRQEMAWSCLFQFASREGPDGVGRVGVDSVDVLSIDEG